MSLVKRDLVIKITNTKPAFTCSKSTTETPEQGAIVTTSSLSTSNTSHTLFIVKTNIVKLSKYSRQ